MWKMQLKAKCQTLGFNFHELRFDSYFSSWLGHEEEPPIFFIIIEICLSILITSNPSSRTVGRKGLNVKIFRLIVIYMI